MRRRSTLRARKIGRANKSRNCARVCCELEETFLAIQRGQVDAVVVNGADGDQVFTLQGAEHPYRVLVETMNEGAATLDKDGTVLYGNASFARNSGSARRGYNWNSVAETFQRCRSTRN